MKLMPLELKPKTAVEFRAVVTCFKCHCVACYGDAKVMGWAAIRDAEPFTFICARCQDENH